MTGDLELMTNVASAPGRRKFWPLPAVLFGILLASSFAVGPIWRWLGPAPPLSPGLRMVAAGRYEQAAPLLQAYLNYNPKDADARAAMAEVVFHGTECAPEVQARKALALLEGNRYANPSRQANALVLQGKAFDVTQQLGKAEAAYAQALRIDPDVAEAGWLLLQTYYREGRYEETGVLALRLARSEPDRRDRVRLLLEPCRLDALPLSDAGVVADLEKASRADPDDFAVNLAYYRALAGNGSEIDRAMTGLRKLVAQHPNEVRAWDGLLGALVITGQLDELAASLARIPPEIAGNPRILRHRGVLALEQGDYAAAIQHLTATIAARPFDVKSRHRLVTAYKRAGKLQEAEEARRGEDQYEQARLALRGIQSTKDKEGWPGAYQRATEQPNLGLVNDLPLYHELASIRERMGHPKEAIAWHRLILEASPDDAESLQALERLEKPASRS